MRSLNVNILASSSSGNAIVVSDGVSSILLDAGLPYSKLSAKTDINEIEAVFVTHEHGDHSKAVGELMFRGMDVFLSKGTFEALNPKTPSALLARHGVQRETRNWTVLPFNVDHDAAEPLGFLIQSKNTGKKLCYIVDSAIVEFSFPKVNTWIIEANYAEDRLQDSSHEEWLKDRIRRSHFSIDNLKDFLSSSDLSVTEEIHLVHLSDSNSDERRFKKEIEELTGVPTYTDTDSLPITVAG